MITYKIVREWYNNIYYSSVDPNRPFWHYEIYLKYLGIRNEKNKKLLDIACGFGKLIGKALAKGISCYGIDISDKAIALAKQSYPQCEFEIGIAERLPYSDSSFDYTVCLGSLEHFLDMDLALREMHRVTKLTGKVLIMVPNVYFPYNPGTEQQDIKETLLSLDEWKIILENNKLVVERIYPDRWPINSILLSKKNPVKFTLGIYRRLKIYLLSLKKSYQFIFVCSVKK